MAKQKDEDQNKRLITAKGLHFDKENSMYLWRPLIVESYDQKSQIFTVKWRGTNEIA